MIFEAKESDEVVSDVYGIYNRVKFQKNRFEPDLAYIESYAEAYEIVRRKSIAALKAKSTKRMVDALGEREKTLPKPKLQGEKLFGWQKLVYERLPEGTFRSSDMYAYEQEFREFYPENQYIRDKIRQILQQLRDLNLLQHIDRDRWRKV